MAAPAKGKICSRCFAHVKETDTVCSECGAPLKTDGSAQAFDSAEHGELAQANLMRLRGDIAGAEKQCLSILKKFPNEPEAHSLLGELSADKGDIPRAIEWYELALDLSPANTVDRERLAQLRSQLHSRQTVQVEEQLGIPVVPNRTPWIVAAVAAVVLLVAVGAYEASKKPPAAVNVNGGTMSAPKLSPNPVATADNTGTTGEAKPTNETAPETSSTPTKPGLPLAMDDLALLQLLQQHSTEGANITALEQDPRDKALMVTFRIPAAEDPKKLGAIIARDALMQSADTLIVTVRGVSNDRLVFVADGMRPKLNGIESQSPNNDTWMNGFLQNEWPAPAATEPPATPTPAPSTPPPTTPAPTPPAETSSTTA